MNMNITANQPASPMPHAPCPCPVCEYFAPCSMACSKLSKITRVFLCFSNEIDAFFISGARTIFQHFSTARVTSAPFARTSIFQRRFDRCRCVDRSRCSKMIENLHAFSYFCIMKSTLARTPFFQAYTLLSINSYRYFLFAPSPFPFSFHILSFSPFSLLSPF